MAVSLPHPASLSDAELVAVCDIERTRRGGPGGQHRNKVETAIVVWHRPTGISAQASERRSQPENQRMALSRLRVALALKFRVERDLSDVPSLLWRSRLNGGRISVNSEHTDFPALLAEAFDVLQMEEYDTPRAAERLACTATQLVKLIKQEPAGLETLNQERSARGLRPLR